MHDYENRAKQSRKKLVRRVMFTFEGFPVASYNNFALERRGLVVRSTRTNQLERVKCANYRSKLHVFSELCAADMRIGCVYKAWIWFGRGFVSGFCGC